MREEAAEVSLATQALPLPSVSPDQHWNKDFINSKGRVISLPFRRGATGAGDVLRD